MFDPKKFLELGEAIMNCDDLDLYAKYRTAINRAYYSTFLTLREHFFGRPEPRHIDVYYKIKQQNRILAKKFDRLWIRRIASDYFLKLPMSIQGFEGDFHRNIKCDENDAIRAINLAKKILNSIVSRST